MKNEIILYHPNELTEHIEVRLEDETVWLSLNRMAQLFDRYKSVISRHLRNVFKSGELIYDATVAKNATVQMELIGEFYFLYLRKLSFLPLYDI